MPCFRTCSAYRRVSSQLSGEPCDSSPMPAPGSEGDRKRTASRSTSSERSAPSAALRGGSEPGAARDGGGASGRDSALSAGSPAPPLRPAPAPRGQLRGHGGGGGGAGPSGLGGPARPSWRIEGCETFTPAGQRPGRSLRCSFLHVCLCKHLAAARWALGSS